MTKTLFMDKYPVHTLEIQKHETKLKTVDEFLSYFQSKIDAHPVATFIALFDHYSHTRNINGEINPDILDAKNIIFCFGSMIPNTKMLAARPRSIAIAALKDSFVIEFMEAPNEKLQEVMSGWVKELITID